MNPISLIRRLLFRLAMDVRLGKLNPWIMGLALGRWPHKGEDFRPRR